MLDKVSNQMSTPHFSFFEREHINNHQLTQIFEPDKYGLKTSRSGHSIAVIGDGAITGGMAWEAMNHAVDPVPLSATRATWRFSTSLRLVAWAPNVSDPWDRAAQVERLVKKSTVSTGGHLE